MAIISLIAAIDENRGLGKDNKLLCHLPADLKYFKTLTLGKPVIMGRKTYESIGKALPGRLNVVLSKHVREMAGATTVNSLEHALQLTVAAAEVMIIGGANIFVAALPVADRIYLTVIHHQFDADVFFPLFDEAQWCCQESTYRPADETNKFAMTFYRYERLA